MVTRNSISYRAAETGTYQEVSLLLFNFIYEKHCLLDLDILILVKL